MSDWLTTLADSVRRQQPAVLVTVAATRGSTPRETGTCMVVGAEQCHGTIGGGRLEFEAIAVAREWLADADADADAVFPKLRRFALGPSLGQCCGGVALLLFEPIAAAATTTDWLDRLLDLRRRQRAALLASRVDTGAKLVVSADDCYGDLADAELQQDVIARARRILAAAGGAELRRFAPRAGAEIEIMLQSLTASDFHIVLFGAGHVGKALVEVLRGLPCTLSWVDSRPEQFPPDVSTAQIEVRVSDEPEYEVDDAPPGSYFLVMTHSHPLDQAICGRILQHNDFRYCGLIGSASKRAKFEHRLRGQGISAEALQALTCPIGVDGIDAKHPRAIAIGVAAQLLQVHEKAAAAGDG